MLFSIFINFDIWHPINKIVALATVVFATIISKISTKVKKKDEFYTKTTKKSHLPTKQVRKVIA